MKNIQLFNEDNLEVMKRLPDEIIDVICIDPPYLYLKNQKLERPFDEVKFFSECARLLTKNGFIVMFGRGESFYRWNTLLENTRLHQGKYVYVEKKVAILNNVDIRENYTYNGLDVTNDKAFKKVFTFKEEIIWDKNYNSSAVHPLSRVHETISIFSKGNGVLNKIKVPYLESKKDDLHKIVGDIKRLRCVLSKSFELENVQSYLENKIIPIVGDEKEATTTLQKGVNKNSVTASVMQMIEVGMNEKSVIRTEHERYSRIHPTQKPVRLLERLLALVIPKDKPREETVVADFFAGSMSCMEAVHNMGMQGIATEIDKEYFEDGKQRIEKLQLCTISK